MIAVVSSTIAPSAAPSHDGARTTFSPAERLAHTRGTVDSLLAAGIADILIADNSAGGWEDSWTTSLAPAKILTCVQPAYRNKGIGEMHLLLATLSRLPATGPVLKISGRYRIGPQSPLLRATDGDVVARVYQQGRRREISTRAYLMRDRSVADKLWRRTLEEMYRQPNRIVGPRSLLAFARRIFRGPTGDPKDPVASVELAAYAALRHLGLRLAAVDHLAVEGILGSWTNPEIKE